MNNAQLVPYPAIFPTACVGCGSHEGTMVDTMIERPGIGRVYLCTKICAPIIARVAGLVEGDRMQQLLDSATEIQRLEQDVAQREDRLHQASEVMELQTERIEQLVGELEAERGRTAVMVQLGETIADTADQLRSTIEELRASAEPVENPHLPENYKPVAVGADVANETHGTETLPYGEGDR